MSSWFKTFCNLQGGHKAESTAYLCTSNGQAEEASRQLFDKLAKLHRENRVNWYDALPPALQAYHELPGPTGVSPHVALSDRDLTSTEIPWH